MKDDAYLGDLHFFPLLKLGAEEISTERNSAGIDTYR